MIDNTIVWKWASTYCNKFIIKNDRLYIQHPGYMSIIDINTGSTIARDSTGGYEHELSYIDNNVLITEEGYFTDLNFYKLYDGVPSKSRRFRINNEYKCTLTKHHNSVFGSIVGYGCGYIVYSYYDPNEMHGEKVYKEGVYIMDFN